LHGHDRASEEPKGIIPRGSAAEGAAGAGCRACPAVLYLLFGMFVITACIIGCSDRKTGQSAEGKAEQRQDNNEEIASKPNSGEIDDTAQDRGLTQNVFTQLEMKNPRMNGPEVLALQNRLLELQFYELGEADGYYGPMTESVIKKIQDYRGLPATGIVDKELWDFIFDDYKILFLSDIQTYNRDNLGRSENLGLGIYGSGDYEDNIFVYYTVKDKKIKIIESLNGQLMYSIKMICYFINENDCRIEFSFSGVDYFIEENGFEEENGNIYYIINSVLYRDKNGTKEWQYDVHGILDRINRIKNEFNARYG
jgi:peptidoglycan hydrolase-like protein with peptidoglycan-binding domain